MFNFFRKKEPNNKNASPVWRNSSGIIICPGDNCPQECDSTCPIYLNTEGIMLIQVGNYLGAIKKYEEAVTIAPDFYDGWNNLAAAYGGVGEYLNAYGCYKKAHDLFPQKIPPVYGLALCCRDLNRNEECLYWCDCYDQSCSDNRVDSIKKEVLSRCEAEKAEPLDPGSELKTRDHFETNSAIDNYNDLCDGDSTIQEIYTSNNGLPDDSELPSLLYGKYFLMLLDAETRETGYDNLERLEDSLPEAGIVVGQRYLASDKTKAYKHFMKAAEAGIADSSTIHYFGRPFKFTASSLCIAGITLSVDLNLLEIDIKYLTIMVLKQQVY